jgi:hypothetical protein
MGFYELIAWALIASFGGMAVIGTALYGIGLAFNYFFIERGGK